MASKDSSDQRKKRPNLSPDTQAAQASKQTRLADQLRANLRKRKQQKRLRGEGADQAAEVLKGEP